MKTLYVDADIIAYKSAAAAEQPIDWGEGMWTLHAFEAEVEAKIDDSMLKLQEESQGLPVKAVLSDSHNFRKDVAPYYKENRKNIRRPMLLQHAKAYMQDRWEGFAWKNLEADDTLGILCSQSKDNLIWSADKDLLTIPGLHLIDGTVQEITEQKADYHFFYQTLTGDITDNYPGCPKVGPKTAEKHLEKHGSSWESVVMAFIKAGLNEDTALENARLARILRDGEYNLTTGEVYLWNP